MSRRRLAAASSLLVLLAVAPRASASVAFPEALRQELELDAVVPPAPGCRVCHKDDVGGLKTVTTPFGRSMLAAGTTAANVAAMVGSVRALDTEGTDSDRDGVGDVAEIRAGTDPNVAQSPDGSPVEPVESVPLPETGCNVTGAVTPRMAPWAGLALLWLLVRARRR